MHPGFYAVYFTLERMRTSSSEAENWKVLVAALEDFLGDRIGITEGCRYIVDIVRTIGEGNSDLLEPFVAFDSQTDRFPIGPVRARWAPSILDENDKERMRFEELSRPWLMEAAQLLLEYARRHAL